MAQYKPLPGIYMILCKENLKVYIGSSKSIKKRWNTHRDWLARNKHSNEHLQRTYNKYGKESFVYSILEQCSEDLLVENENKWINKYDSLNPDKGYNKTPAGKYPEKYIKSENFKREYRKIFWVNKNRILDITTASIESNIPRNKVVKVCYYWRNYNKAKKSSGYKSFKGNVFVYIEDYNKEFDYLHSLNFKKQFKDIKDWTNPDAKKEYMREYWQKRKMKVEIVERRNL